MAQKGGRGWVGIRYASNTKLICNFINASLVRIWVSAKWKAQRLCERNRAEIVRCRIYATGCTTETVI